MTLQEKDLNNVGDKVRIQALRQAYHQDKNQVLTQVLSQIWNKFLIQTLLHVRS